MILIIGGAYQGKLDYAKATFALNDKDIFTCTDTYIDFSKPCIDHLEEFTLACVHSDMDPVEYFKTHQENWQNSILICQDIFCGVVPLGADMRAWRRATGRLCQYLSGQAQQVSRIFCGLEQRLK
ncbi:MAG: bifunctional adenosylcobinamide kinase/adenosylcobinamide-phosphate guanylyltransferase [Firmicutes bacterium]|nr:bifunctional adenosylcobinamide kinase/adenosylcobinamide-phosphate guanylyltransferase [Bacillota bacterium]